MLDEYKKLLSWSEIRKLNSMEELRGLPTYLQLRYTVISMIKALTHWQVWASMAFLALCVYIGREFGDFVGMKIGRINIFVLIFGAFGGAVYGIIHLNEARKHIRKFIKKQE